MSRFVRRIARFSRRALCALAAASPLASLASPCAATVAELRTLVGDPFFPLAWEETSMRDARPLLASIDERPDGLFISFSKSGEGLWAEGVATLCRHGERLEARFLAGQLKVGPAAGWLLRRGLEGGAPIALKPVSARELRIGTLGWAGSFVPASSKVGLRAP